MLVTTTKCLFRHACGKRLINANPRRGIMLSALLGERPLTLNSAPAPDAHARDTEAAAGRAHAPPEIDDSALAIRILRATALRSAELYQAKWADLDLDGAQWHIPKSKTGAEMDTVHRVWSSRSSDFWSSSQRRLNLSAASTVSRAISYPHMGTEQTVHEVGMQLFKSFKQQKNRTNP